MKILSILIFSSTLLLGGAFDTGRDKPKIDYFKVPRSFRASISLTEGMGAETTEMEQLISTSELVTLSAGWRRNKCQYRLLFYPKY